MRKAGSGLWYWFFFLIHKSGGTPSASEIRITQTGATRLTQNGDVRVTQGD